MHFDLTLIIMIPIWAAFGLLLITFTDYCNSARTAAERRCHEALRRLDES